MLNYNKGHRRLKTISISLSVITIAALLLQVFTFNPPTKVANAIGEPTKITLTTCTGTGDLYLYQGSDPFQAIDTSFTVSHNQVLIFTRQDPTLAATVNGVPRAFASTFTIDGSVKVFVLNTASGDIVGITGISTNNARDIQGYLSQDTGSPVYDLSTLQYIWDDVQANDMYLTPGNYNYIFFDKYTYNSPGDPLPDTRNLTATVTQGATTIVNQSYNQPAPVGTQGAVVGSYTIPSAGTYTLSVDTEDSVYWPLAMCPELPDKATLIVIKHVINDNSGTKVAADFTMNVTAVNPSSASFPGEEAPGVSVTVDPGDYSVNEADSLGYTKTLSADCTGTIAAGETKTCTITNNDPSGGGGCVGPSCGGGGCTGASCNPNPSPVNASITCGPNATLSFVYGSDVSGISISNNMDFSGVTAISPVPSINWAIPAGDNHTVYVKFQRANGSIEIRQPITANCTPPPEVLSCTNLVTAESEQVTKPNQSLVNHNKGKILVQSEAHGEIWYVYPATSSKFYIPGKPHTVTTISLFADGISNVDLSKIPLGISQNIIGSDTDNDGLNDILETAYGTSVNSADTDADSFTDKVEIENGYNPTGSGKLPIDLDFTNQQKGRFFLQVEGAGQIWYVNPADGKRYFIPSDSVNAYNVLASLAEDITNADIRQIPVGLEARGVDVSAFAGCYYPTPIVLGATELPRTGFPFDIAQLVILPSLAAYPWLKRRYSSALANHFAKVAE